MTMPAERISGTRNLGQLLDGFASAPPVEVRGLTDDSRRIRPGDVFVACQGASAHGLDFASAAVSAGASAVIWDATTGSAALATGEVPFVAVPDLAGRLGELANRWYDTPSAALDVVGVTGTNGKTTVAFLVAQSLKLLGRNAGYIGTLGYGTDDLEVDLGMTTPPCLDLHAKVAAFRDAGATAAAIEVSSHALDQRRLDGVKVETAVFTNLSRDHIDYHGSMRAYAETKSRLFTDFDCRHRIVSIDTEYGNELAGRLDEDTITTSNRFDRIVNGKRFVFVRSSAATESGSRILVESSWGGGEVHVPMPGEFNVSNAIQVLAFLLVHGVDFSEAARTIASLTAPPGRLQLVNARADVELPRVYVDYAHTPAALEAVLKALRPHSAGRLWCVFGCGGDRDRGKRPTMGKVVSRLADSAIATNDNPRSEEPATILAEIAAGAGRPLTVIEDRAAAIAWAVAEAAAGDTVLIAGKGHEDYQIIGEKRLDFSDVQIARANLDARKRSRGETGA